MKAFVINGEILAWDPLRRELQIGTHLVFVAPSVTVAKLKCGGTVSGLSVSATGSTAECIASTALSSTWWLSPECPSSRWRSSAVCILSR
jgi:hypothetical protein